LEIKVGPRDGFNCHGRSIELSDNFGFFLLACINNRVNLNPGNGTLLFMRKSMGMVEGSVVVPLHDGFLLASLLPVGYTLMEGLCQASTT
jgi:hypothetical protein